MSKTNKAVRTVAELRALLAGLPDDALVGVGCEQVGDEQVSQLVGFSVVATSVVSDEDGCVEQASPAVVLWFGDVLFETV